MTANEVAPRRRTCPLCEAMCGLTLEVSGDRVLAVRGDPEDAFSRGYICPKAVGLMDVHHDPDRLGQPLLRRNGTWERAGWDDAVAETVKRLADIRRAYGDDAVAFYVGNPTTHSYSGHTRRPRVRQGAEQPQCVLHGVGGLPTAHVRRLPQLREPGPAPRAGSGSHPLPAHLRGQPGGVEREPHVRAQHGPPPQGPTVARGPAGR